MKEPQSYSRVDIFFWRPKHGINFGDYLASAIVQRMLARAELLSDEEVGKPRRLLSVGSVLHFAKDGDTLWGTGRNGKIGAEKHLFSSLDVRAVRGPKTRAFLIDRGLQVPEVYGDPGLLIPILFGNRFCKKAVSGRIGVIQNLNDAPINLRDNRLFLIDPRERWSTVVDKILTCEFIISSSLHGLVVADAFGIPCRFVRLSEDEPDFKYLDYFGGVGRENLRPAKTITEALNEDPLPPIEFNSQSLMDAFPFDLWTD